MFELDQLIKSIGLWINWVTVQIETLNRLTHKSSINRLNRLEIVWPGLSNSTTYPIIKSSVFFHSRSYKTLMQIKRFSTLNRLRNAYPQFYYRRYCCKFVAKTCNQLLLQKLGPLNVIPNIKQQTIHFVLFFRILSPTIPNR